MTTGGSGGPLDASERAELERLRAVVNTPRAPYIRWTVTVVLLVLVAVLGLTSVLARFAHSVVLDTDRYVEVVTPLASDPVVQAALTDRVTAATMERLDIEQTTIEALTALQETAPRIPPAVVGLAPLVEAQTETFVRRTAASVITSDRFETLWIEANQAAHEGVVAVLTGDTEAGTIAEDGTVSLQLGPIVDRVRAALTERGFAVAESIPDVDASFTLFQSPALVKAQKLTSALNAASTVLPWVTAAVALLVVWVSPDGRRLRALSLVGVALGAAMALLAVALAVARARYLDGVADPTTAAVLVDTVLGPVRTMLRAVFVVAFVVAVAAYIAGSSSSAAAIRGGYGRAVDVVRKPRAPSSFESAVARYRVPIRVMIFALAAFVLVFWRYPSGLVVAVVAVVAAVALLLVEFVTRPAMLEAKT